VSDPRVRSILPAMCCVIGIVLLDESGVAIALVSIRDGFDLSASQANWVISAYLLSLSATVAAFGRLADLLGQRRILIGGMLVFGVMSVAAGLSPTYELLIEARVLQGLGAAAALPASAAILRATTPPEQLGRALGHYGLASAVGLASGPFVGGILTELISWRAVFLLSAPVVGFVVWVAAFRIEEPERDAAPSRASFDNAGLGCLILTLAAVVGALMQGPVWGWTSPATIALLGVGIAGAIVLVRLESNHPWPIVEIDLFRNASFSSANGMTFLAQFSKTAVIIYGALYLIDDFEMSPATAGLALLPGIVAAMPTGPLSGRLVDRVGVRRPMLVCLVLLFAALVYLSLTVPLDRYAWLVPGLLAWGVANTCIFVCSRRSVQGSVPPSKNGQASGINATAQWLGAALSVPTLGVFVVSPPVHFPRVYLAAAGVAALATWIAWRHFERNGNGT
jgi:EmrB/QacA subfamily drug resistance transporter